jgi:hypothetical protein
MNDHDHDDGAVLAFRLSCRRCRQDFVTTFDDADDYHRTEVLGCPSCMGTETDSTGTEKARDFPDGFEVFDRTVTSEAFVDVFADFDDLADGPLTDTQAADYWAVEVDGKTGGRRARERGVKRGTVGKAVARARRKIRGDV